MSVVTPMPEITDMILEFGGQDMLRCMQCGTCTAVCPWGLVETGLSPRLILRQIQTGVEGYEAETLWRCVTCNTCVVRCPREIDIVDSIKAARSAMLSMGMGPQGFKSVLASLQNEGNPWGADEADRNNSLKEFDLPEFEEEMQLLFACCTHSYDSRNSKSLSALVEILVKAGIPLGTLGEEQHCCGDQGGKCGGFDEANELQEHNEELFEDNSVQNVLVTSPHCRDRIKKYNNPPKVKHYTEELFDLVNKGALVFDKEVKKKVAYHDPCYLGRHGGIYDEPRSVLRAIPSLTLIPFKRDREKALCCGGGGGGVWQEVAKEERFSVLRVQEALEVGADVIATACPFCTIMLEDAIRALGVDEEICVMEIPQLLRLGLG